MFLLLQHPPEQVSDESKDKLSGWEVFYPILLMFSLFLFLMMIRQPLP